MEKKPTIWYQGSIEKDFREELEKKTAELIAKDLPFSFRFVNHKELEREAIYLQPGLPKNKPLWQSNWRIGVWTDKISISQDKMTSLIIWLAGYTRIQTTVNRAAHIGAFGISGAWHRDVVLDEFPEDKTTLQFRE